MTDQDFQGIFNYLWAHYSAYSYFYWRVQIWPRPKKEMK